MKKLFYSILVVLSTWSCNSWLDVQPYDQVAESVAFSSFSGFENALNGIYIELNSTSLYGNNIPIRSPVVKIVLPVYGVRLTI